MNAVFTPRSRGQTEDIDNVSSTASSRHECQSQQLTCDADDIDMSPESVVGCADKRPGLASQTQRCRDEHSILRARHWAMLENLHRIAEDLGALQTENTDLRDANRGLTWMLQASDTELLEEVGQLRQNELRLQASNAKLAEQVQQLEAMFGSLCIAECVPGPVDLPLLIPVSKGALEYRWLGFFRFSWSCMSVSLSGSRLVIQSDGMDDGVSPDGVVHLRGDFTVERTSPYQWRVHGSPGASGGGLLDFEWRAPTPECACQWIQRLEAACAQDLLLTRTVRAGQHRRFSVPGVNASAQHI